MIDTGATLTQRRQLIFKSKMAAWKALTNSGLNISYARYRRLEAGAWPTLEEAHAIPKEMEMSLTYWLTGDTREMDLAHKLSLLDQKTEAALKLALQEFVRKMTDC